MPCRSDYLDADNREIELSRVACLLDELNGQPIVKNHWEGYHPRVYNMQADGDALVAELCSKLQRTDVSKCSLEMQIWCRDHQAADEKRLKAELAAKKTEAQRQKALKKLTPHERKLLGL